MRIIQQIMKYIYLGISSDRDLLEEVHIQTNTANRIAGETLYGETDIRWLKTKNKVRIYKMYIRPILTYAAETQVEKSKTKRILRIAKTRMF
jgi:hypothetical protein